MENNQRKKDQTNKLEKTKKNQQTKKKTDARTVLAFLEQQQA